MTPERSLALNQRIYRSLLLLYPRAFRQVYGREMVQVFGDKLRDERERSGHRASLAVWLRTLLDLFKSAPTQRMEKTMSREAAFAIAFALILAVAVAFFMMGVGGLAINVILGVLIIAAIGLGASGFLRKKGSRAKPEPAGKISAKDWWVVLAAVIGFAEIVAIVGETIRDPKASNFAALVVVPTFGALMLAGAWVRTKKSRNAGDWMIVIGVLPLLGLWWMPPIAVIAVVIMVMAIRDTFKGRDSEAAAA